MQLGLPVRIVGLVGLLLALAVGAWTFAAGGSSTSKDTGTASASTSKQVGSVAQNPIAAAHSVATKLSAHNRNTAAGKPDVVPKTQTKPAHAVTMHARKSPAPAKATGGTPTTIASVLRHHRVAVVLLYDPHAKVDSLSVGEAQLGAGRAHAGFLRVDVSKQKQIEAFAKTYGILPVPTVLFFARPGKLVQKLVGFADQETVAQAALNAARGLVATQG